MGTATSFEAMFDFLHNYYFPQASFESVYFTSYKTFVFINQLDFIEFTEDKNGLQLLIKYRNWIWY